ASARATVAVAQVTVVALLALERDAVTAARDAGLAGLADRFGLTRRRAAVDGRLVAVVAALGAFADLVAADRARAHDRVALALEARLQAAAVGAADAAQHVALVAALVGIGDAVAAKVDPGARGPWLSTHVAGLDQVAALRAAVAAVCVAVIACFAGPEHSVPADDGRNARLSGRGALVVRFDDTGAATPVAR